MSRPSLWLYFDVELTDRNDPWTGPASQTGNNPYDLNAAEAVESSELMELVSARLKEAIKSTRHAQRKVSRALHALSSKER